MLEFLENSEMPLLGPNYWISKKIGLLLPNNKFAKFVYIILHEMVLLYVISQYMELYVIRSDLNEVLNNLKISMLSAVCVVKVHIFICYQDSWRQLFEYATAADVYERINRDEEKGKIIDNYTRYCRKATYFYWSLVYTTLLTIISQPALKYVTSEHYRESLNNGTELFVHIMSSWMPFDKYHSPGFWVTIVWHILMSTYGATVVATYDSTVMVMLVFFGGRMDILRVRCKQMLGQYNVAVSDEEADITVKQLHDAYVLLMKYSKLFNSLLSPVMFMYVVMCSLVICASAFQLTTSINTTQKLLMAEYVLFGIVQLFIFCWHSNDVIAKNENLMLGPYESEWWAASVRQKKNILLLAGQLKTVHVYTAGPFTNLTISTFVTILKGAYSYYTLLSDHS